MRLANLEIPNQPEFVSLARLVVSSVAADRYELSDDQLDDLKLALSEACVLVLEGDDAAGAITVSCEGTNDRLTVSVSSARPSFGAGRSTSADAIDAALTSDVHLGLPLISSLVDEMLVEPLGDGDCLCLTVLCTKD